MEILTWALCSRAENFGHLRRPDDGQTAVAIGNPATAEFEVCRTSLLPGEEPLLRRSGAAGSSFECPVTTFWQKFVLFTLCTISRASSWCCTPSSQGVHCRALFRMSNVCPALHKGANSSAGALKTLGGNKSAPLPVRLFDVSDVVLLDAATDTGARNERRCVFDSPRPDEPHNPNMLTLNNPPHARPSLQRMWCFARSPSCCVSICCAISPA